MLNAHSWKWCMYTRRWLDYLDVLSVVQMKPSCIKYNLTNARCFLSAEYLIVAYKMKRTVILWRYWIIWSVNEFIIWYGNSDRDEDEEDTLWVNAGTKKFVRNIRDCFFCHHEHTHQWISVSSVLQDSRISTTVQFSIQECMRRMPQRSPTSQFLCSLFFKPYLYSARNLKDALMCSQNKPKDNEAMNRTQVDNHGQQATYLFVYVRWSQLCTMTDHSIFFLWTKY